MPQVIFVFPTSTANNITLFSSKTILIYYLIIHFNPMFERLPSQVKDELKIMCVLFTEDIGGVLSLKFDAEGNL